MEKTRINLEILLPEVLDERDECVSRVIRSLETIRGIEKVHVIPKGDNAKAQVCFHYDPDTISIHKVEQLAKAAGAEITDHYGHLLIETSGIRHPRRARVIEAGIEKQKGVSAVSVSGTGFIQVEYKKTDTS